jgi:asparagine synthetase B (glutamine-hydrolysing)
MFAFAIYDKPRHRFFLARDRFGEKPLYYLARPGLFVFASELTGILKHPLASHSLDIRSVQKFFAHGYLPAPNALYEHSRKLPGGCYPVDGVRMERVIKRWFQHRAGKADQRLFLWNWLALQATLNGTSKPTAEALNCVWEIQTALRSHDSQN